MWWMREQGELCKDEQGQLVKEVGRNFVRNWEAQQSLLGPEGCGCCLCVQEGCCGMGMGKVVRVFMSGAVSTAAHEPGILQICVSHSPGLGVEEGVSSTWSFSCGWSLPEASPGENSLTSLKCELTPKPLGVYQLSLLPIFMDFLQHLWDPCSTTRFAASPELWGQELGLHRGEVGWICCIPVKKTNKNQNKISYPIRTTLNLY